MNHISFRGAIFLILAVLIVTIQPSNLPAQTQEKESVGKVGGLPASGPGVEKPFHDARKNFLEKEYQNAAAEIRRGAAFLDAEARLATDARKKALIASARELDQLADLEQKGALHSVQELERAFARAEHVLAGYYHSKALQSWYGKAVPDAGPHLKAAAVHLENALKWAGEREETGRGEVIREGGNRSGKRWKKEGPGSSLK